MSVDNEGNNPFGDYITTGSAGSILNVSPARVHTLFDRGEFPTGILIAGYKFMTEIEVLAYKIRRDAKRDKDFPQ